MRHKLYMDHERYVIAQKNLQHENFALADQVIRVEHDKKNLLIIIASRDATIASQAKDVDDLQDELKEVREVITVHSNRDEMVKRLANARQTIADKDATIKELLDVKKDSSQSQKSSPRISGELEQLRKK